MLQNGRQNVKILGRDQAIIREFIEAHSPLNYQTNGRIILNK